MQSWLVVEVDLISAHGEAPAARPSGARRTSRRSPSGP